jgi:hypothetical protein
MNFRNSRNIWTTLFYSLLAIDLGLFGVSGWLDFVPSAQAQTSSQYPELDKNGKPLLPRPGPQVVYSPTDLGHNAVTLPASGTTPTGKGANAFRQLHTDDHCHDKRVHRG